MTILKNDYLYNYILKFIFNHFYCYTISNLPFTTPYPNDDNLTNCYYETIQYSLVSKRFFRLVSSNLSNLLKFKNYDILKRFIEKRNSETSSLYSLIKLDGSTVIYNSLEEYERDESLGLIGTFRKCLVSLEGSVNSDCEEATKRSVEYLLSSKVYPDNVQFNIELSLSGTFNSNGGGGGGRSIRTRSDTSIKSELFNYDFNLLLSNISKKKISIIYIDHYNKDNRIIFENISKLNAKHIVYINECEDNSFVHFEEVHSDFSSLLKNPTLKSLELENDYLDPHYLLGINNSNTSLKSLHLLMRFNNLVRGLNGDTGFFVGILASRNVEEDWNHSIRSILLNNKTIKYLILEEKDYERDIFESDIKTSLLTNAFKVLFSSPSCSIETLELNRIDFIDLHFLNGLKNNKSITTLTLIDINPRAIASRVLPLNKTIKNLILYKIRYNYLRDFIKILAMYQSKTNYIDLYSVTLNLDILESNQIQTIKDEIQSNSFSIKEFNIYIKKENSISTTPQIIINNNNNTIINFRYK